MHFVETMRGELTSVGGGAPQVVCFHVEARGRREALQVSGVVHAGQWCPEGEATGELCLSLAPARIAYDVRFVGRDGRRLALVGAKHPAFTAPVKSMTQLVCELRELESGVVLARGELRFELDELPAFLASWLPVATLAGRRLALRRADVVRRALLGEVGASTGVG